MPDLFVQTRLAVAAGDASGEDLVAGSIDATDAAIALSIIVLGLVLGSIARRVVRRVFLRGAEHQHIPVDVTATGLVARTAQIAVVIAAIVYALISLGVRVGPLLGAIGIGGVALAFALQDTLENFFSGLILQLRRPFLVGDQVTIGEQEGIVQDIGFRYVRVRQFDGTVALIPAVNVLQNVVINNTAEEHRRTAVPVGVAYDTDLARAREVVREAAASSEFVVADPATDVLLTRFGDSSIELVARFWHDPARGDGLRARDDVIERIHVALAVAKIEIPFPQRVLHEARSD